MKKEAVDGRGVWGGITRNGTPIGDFHALSMEYRTTPASDPFPNNRIPHFSITRIDAGKCG
jgi:hypothetical protein